MQADIELIVTDLDGTLWELPASTPEVTRTALATVLAGEVPLLVATGRRVASTRAPLADLGVAPPAICLNGALGLDLTTDDRFHVGGFSAADAATVLSVFSNHGVDPCVYVNRDGPSVFVSATPSTHPDHLRGFGTDVGVAALDDVIGTDTVLGFSVLGVDQAVAEALGLDLAGLASPHTDVDRQYGGFSFTVAPPTGSKWDGIAAFCAREGLDASSVLVMGDGPNDLEMLEAAAVAVVPEDAHVDALALADHVIGRASLGGWAEILDLLDRV